jgi:RNA polymerase sigma factor (sigma-70 family)
MSWSNIYPDPRLKEWEHILTPLVNKIVKRIYKGHLQYVEMDDLRQEGWMWVAEHTDLVSETIESDETKDYRLTERLIYPRIRANLHRYCMQQRYLKDGTKPGDYHFYTAEQVADLLPDVFDGTRSTRSSSELSDTRSTRSPSEGWEYEATVADVQSGLARLKEPERDFLRALFADGGLSTEVMSIQYEVTQRAIQQRTSRILNKVVKNLGGSLPIGRRAAVSNASMQVTTRRQEEGE